MLLLIGLGNPGPKYQNNRHNIGQMFVDYSVKELAGLRVNEFKTDKFLKSQLAKLIINNDEIIFTKSLTFMNNSGIAVKKLIVNCKLKIENLIIIHDDLDIPFGKFHIRFASGPLLHNGLESIENQLQTKDFWRIRIGVDARKPDNKVNGETYVLQNFLPEEKKLLETEIFPKIFFQLKLHLKTQFNILI
jgi:peptidyl-tRNA hydrolase, PTH1 family